MAAPSTGILDNFNRANETTLDWEGRWQDWWAPGPAGGRGSLTGNELQLKRTIEPETAFNAKWATVFTGHQEVYATVTAIGSPYVELAVCAQGDEVIPGGEATGYVARWEAGVLKILRINTGRTAYLIAEAACTLVAGDGLWLERLTSGKLKAYRRHEGAWALICEGEDDGSHGAPFTTGAVAFSARVKMSAWKLDELGGGTVAPPPAGPTSPILDNFNRANETPLSWEGRWADLSGTGIPVLNSNTVRFLNAGATVKRWSAKWTPTTFVAAHEAWVEINEAAHPAVEVWVCANGTTAGTATGYTLRWESGAGGMFTLNRVDPSGGVGRLTTVLGTGVPGTLVAGDALWLTWTAGTLKGYYRHGGVWTQVLEAADATYKEGHIGFCAESIESTWRLDNFGGGALAPEGPSHTDHGKGTIVLAGKGADSWHIGEYQAPGSMVEPRAIDPSFCWLRHIVRGGPTDTIVGRVTFADADDTDGLNGRQGWQAADVTAALMDDGTFTVTFPNVPGEDGVLHRRRFKILTDPGYEPGEEWIAFYRDPNDLLLVGTPTEYEKARGTVTIKGRDAGIVLDGSESSEIDQWDAAGPADVLRHYSRLVVLAYGADLAVTQTGAVGAWSAGYTQALTGVQADCWTAEARIRWTSARPAAKSVSYVSLDLYAGLSLWVDVFDGTAAFSGAPEVEQLGKRMGLTVPGDVSLRIVARYDRLFAFVGGELVAEYRRAAPWPALPQIKVRAYAGTVVIDGFHVETLAPFLGRGASSVIDRRLTPPPAIGLRAQVWGAGGEYARYTTAAGRVARLWPLEAQQAGSDRVDPTVNLTTGAPPGVGGAYAARWSGAIYLDLGYRDYELRLKSLVGCARVYVGRTLRGDEYASSWTAPAATLTGGLLRAWLGIAQAGWWPLVIEQHHSAAVNGIVLEYRVAGGAWGVVPQAALSPYGCYGDLIRLTKHRQVLGDVAQAFGFQWRLLPRDLESGEFPGALVAASPTIGRQTDLVIDELGGTDAAVQGAADDVVDGLLADAAGTAQAGKQLTVRVTDYSRASGHLALRQTYESLADITEAPLLRTRADSLMALRSSPNEQVGVRPRGQRDLVDTFPLSGSLARMGWEPGDAVRLRLDSLDVLDVQPRQMTSVAWPLRPDGVGVPTVSFRQRPRDARAAIAKLSRAIYAPRRTYQGSISIVTGSLGGYDAVGGKPVTGAADDYSRAVLPARLSAISRAVMVVHELLGESWAIEVASGPTLIPVSLAGRYDVTHLLMPREGVDSGLPYTYARLRNGKQVGGGGGAQYLATLEVWMVV